MSSLDLFVNEIMEILYPTNSFPLYVDREVFLPWARNQIEVRVARQVMHNKEFNPNNIVIPELSETIDDINEQFRLTIHNASWPLVEEPIHTTPGGCPTVIENLTMNIPESVMEYFDNVWDEKTSKKRKRINSA
jgi:hypothetical protein